MKTIPAELWDSYPIFIEEAQHAKITRVEVDGEDVTFGCVQCHPVQGWARCYVVSEGRIVPERMVVLQGSIKVFTESGEYVRSPELKKELAEHAGTTEI